MSDNSGTGPRDLNNPELPAPQQPIVIESPIQGEAGRVGQLFPDAAASTWLPDPTAEREKSVPHRNPPDKSVVSDSPPELAAPRDRRALSLDALRGLLLITMTFGFTIMNPDFPGWMYHRQFPAEKFVDIAGITWRDIAYAGFLFSMAAAIPLALSPRMDRGERDVGILMAILRRGFLLVVFALLVGHSNTFFTGYTQTARMLAIVGFVIMAMVFTRRRRDWNEATFRVINIVGWVAAILFLVFSPMLYGKGIDIKRVDDIIIGLAFAAMVGSVVWYLTRDNINARVAVLVLAVAAYLGAKGQGWVADWWWADNFPFFQLNKLGLLTVVIPGTIAGDLLLKWMRSSSSETGVSLYWTNARVKGLAFVCSLMTPVVVIGLYNRWVPETTEIVLGLIIGAGVLVWNAQTESELLVRRIFQWSALWLMTGLLLEPFEGGIHKVPDTLSYFFTVTGLVGMLLVAFVSMVDLLQMRKWVNALIDVGHNPLFCYVLFSVFFNSLFEMIPPLRGVLQNSPGESLLRSILSLILVVLIVRWATRKRIFWRT